MLSDFVEVTITTVSTVLARAGFGIPLILSANMTTTARTAECASLAEVDAVAGISASSPEYKLAQVLFSQARKPTKVILGRLANKPTQVWTIKVPTVPSSGVANSTAYEFLVTQPNDAAEQSVTYTSDADATNAEIIDGLKTAFDALSISGITSSTSGSGDSKVLLLTASAAGTVFSTRVPVAQRGYLWVAASHSDPGFSADLTAIRSENDTWYCVLNPWPSKAYTGAIATAIEALTDTNKIHIARTNETETIQSTSSSGIAQTLATASRERTAVFYSDHNDTYIDAAIAGLMLPTDPGSENWAFKTVSGPAADTLTSTQRANALRSNANVYTSTAGVSITQLGTVASGEHIDVVRGRDWLSARLAEDVFALFTSLIKVPFTDAGIALVETAVRGVLQEGVAVGLLSPDPAPAVTVPKAADVSAEDKAARLLPDVKFTATLAGAINKAQIDGTISV